MKQAHGKILIAIFILLCLTALILLVLNPGNAGNDHLTTAWEARVNGPVKDIVTGDNGTVYAFAGDTGNKIYAFDNNGTLEWEYDVPDTWRVRNVFALSEHLNAESLSTLSKTYSDDSSQGKYITGFSYFQTRLVCAVDQGVLYLYVRENRTTYWNHELNEEFPPQPQSGDWKLRERLMALADNGSLLWDVPISDEHHVYENTDVVAKDGRVYVFDDYTVTVLDDLGTVLFRLDNVSGRPAVDEQGNIYVVPAIPVEPQPPGLTQFYKDPGIEAPANVIEMYAANGSLSWRTDVDGQVWLAGYISLPMFQNGTIWVPVANGIQAFDTNGHIRWAKSYEVHTDWPAWGGSAGLYRFIPLDSHGNVYIYVQGPGDPMASKKSYRIISVSGDETVRENEYETHADAAKGIIFGVSYQYNTIQSDNDDISISTVWTGNMPDIDLAACDLVNDRTLWKYRIKPQINQTMLTSENVDSLLTPKINYRDTSGGIFLGWDGEPMNLLPAGDVLFVTYVWANYESPIVPGKSKCAYVSQIYALDEANGTLLGHMSLDALISASTAGNNMLYYGTGDGRVIGVQIGGIVT